jgi:Protein of unknown function (DUF4013)
VDVGRAFSFVFQDPRWVSKVAIGALMMLIPIFGWLVLFGYTMRVTRLVATTGTDLPLPEWDDFGGLFMEGLRAFGVAFIWSLPLSVITGCLSLGIDNDDVGAQFAVNCLNFLLSIPLGLVLPAALARTAVEGTFNAGLEVGRVLGIVRDRFADYVVVLLIGYAAGIIAVAGFIALCIGVLVTIVYSFLLSAHVYGQAYHRATAGPATTAPAPSPRF